MYFVPGDKDRNDNTTPERKNKNRKRLFIKWTAAFLLVLVLCFRLFHHFYPQGLNDLNLSDSRPHPPPIDLRLLQSKDFGLPAFKPSEEIVRHYAYTLSFSDRDKEAYWVAYTLKRSYLNGKIKRASHFEPDPEVPTGSAVPDDYRNSGYDKGHLAPAADMKWDIEAMKESFYLSNVCPQDHNCNDGIWADLEKSVRYWTIEDSIEYIVTGPVLPAIGQPKIGADHVTVPAYFYKVIFTPFPYPKAVGFIVPNQPGRVSFWHYACSVSQVEKVTGIHFYPMLPADVSDRIKTEYHISDWKSGNSINR